MHSFHHSLALTHTAALASYADAMAPSEYYEEFYDVEVDGLDTLKKRLHIPSTTLPALHFPKPTSEHTPHANTGNPDPSVLARVADVSTDSQGGGVPAVGGEETQTTSKGVVSSATPQLKPVHHRKTSSDTPHDDATLRGDEYVDAYGETWNQPDVHAREDIL